MYSIYYLTSILLLSGFIQKEPRSSKTIIVGVVSVMNHFYSYVIYVLFYLNSVCVKRMRSKVNLSLLHLVFIIILIYKLPFVLIWRFMVRVKDSSESWSSVNYFFIDPLLKAKSFSFICILGLVISTFNVLKKWRSVDNFLSFVMLFHWLILLILLLLNTIELAPRYFLFLFPMSIIILLDFLKELSLHLKKVLTILIISIYGLLYNPTYEIGLLRHLRSIELEDKLLELMSRYPNAPVIVDNTSYFENYFYIYMNQVRGVKLIYTPLNKYANHSNHKDIIYISNFVYDANKLRSFLKDKFSGFDLKYQSPEYIHSVSINHLVIKKP